ncbi:hypothetical protein BC332_20766 [Capsicum chinense]|nr:hypothetical protein BC332_20766 [Capsicum chinense]
MSGANIVEDDQNNSKKRKKAGNKNNQPKKKFKGKCFNCGTISHKSTNYRSPKKEKKKDQANLAESKKEMDDLCAILSECNLVGIPCEWWMDSGATRHVCANKELFSTFVSTQVEEKIYMANSATVFRNRSYSIQFKFPMKIKIKDGSNKEPGAIRLRLDQIPESKYLGTIQSGQHLPYLMKQIHGLKRVKHEDPGSLAAPEPKNPPGHDHPVKCRYGEECWSRGW